MPNSHEQLAFDYSARVTREDKIRDSRRKNRVSSVAEAFVAISKANQYFAFAVQVEKESPLYAKKKRKNPLTGELERYDPERLKELGEFYDEVAQLAMYKACFYCHAKTKERCFINTVDPKIRYDRGFEVWFRHTEDRKNFMIELDKDPDRVCSPTRVHGIDK